MKMATAFSSQHRSAPPGFQQPSVTTGKPVGAFLRHLPRPGSLIKNARIRSWRGVKSGSVEQTGIDLKGLVDFLYADLPHLFDEQGIDRSMYDDRVKFRDPITKHDTIDGYLFNIRLLKLLFRPDFLLHYVRQVCFPSLCNRSLLGNYFPSILATKFVSFYSSTSFVLFLLSCL